jgi:hypothetical protein
VARLRTLALAITGVVIGHSLAYWAAAPNRVTRAQLLQATGHAYWNTAVLGAVLGGLWFAADHVVRLFLAGRRALPTPTAPADLKPVLRVLQITLFVALEVGERAAAGVPLSSILGHRVFVLGVLLQLVIAPALAALVGVLGAAARAAGRATRGEPFLALPGVGALRVFHAAPSIAGAPSLPCGIRGPPLS